MRHSLNGEQIDRLQSAIIDCMRAGWGRDLDVLWDLREKIHEFDRMTCGSARMLLEEHRQAKIPPTFTNYLLIAMQRALEQMERENNERFEGVK